ncbi:cellulose synthase/poly-beta-1,6-N-acetylglucosamine synthase-like glycosyltransferase [Chryseobacterium sp. BIGb0186]|uniref:hypothetical protein n=1 Tax=Chryseobacterium scophthalmum TaxID=59733 RepID=UPI00247DED9F|nr:cellulose synthase/poly-beta-1,6-N-acetylglucosamine synthase-like glycosyltransferase [Chryseobacterium sp. JUb44]MDH6211714.1 cellulose synthase/poly-beta-1,6-N-acetylglucosamine synthase-like glycosyltransferase [Chryseobacterium sp. BIGb0186]
MRLEKVYKYQLFLLIFIVIFGIQHYYLQNFNFEWMYYEKVLNSVFLLSIFTVLFSLIFLIFGSIKTINRKNTIEIEKIYLIINLILYYFTVWISLYLLSQIR